MPSALDAVLRHLSVDEPTVHTQLELWPTDDRSDIAPTEPYDPLGHFGPRLEVPIEGVEEWEAEAGEGPRAQVWIVDVKVRTDSVIDEIMGRVGQSLGFAARDVLRYELDCAMYWAADYFDEDKGSLTNFARAVGRVAWHRFRQRYSWRNLRLEKDDQDRRFAAVMDERAVAPYLDRIARFMARWLAWHRRRPLQFVSQDARCQDLIFDVITHVLELLRSDAPMKAFEPYLRVGRPAFFQVRDHVLGMQRRRDRLWLVEPPGTALQARVPRPDEALHRAQVEARLNGSPFSLLRPHLDKTTVRYLDAICVELDDGRTWGVQQRVAKYLGCSKSRVSEAVARIREVAERLGIDELLHLGDEYMALG